MQVWNIRDPNKPEDAVRVDRTTIYGNPYKIGQDGDRDEVCDKYEDYIERSPELRRLIQKNLRGKDLVCWCKPLRCHGDTLLRIANVETSE